MGERQVCSSRVCLLLFFLSEGLGLASFIPCPLLPHFRSMYFTMFL